LPRLTAFDRMKLFFPLVLPFVLGLAACGTPLPRPGGVVRIESPNFDERRPALVVLHHTSDRTLGEALATLTAPGRKVSAHYVVGRGGEVVQLVDERHRAWHAGASWWGGTADVNSASIGIELDNDGEEPFAEAQIGALLGLLGDIARRYALPAANFVGHADVAPGRKVDPSARFPWRRLAGHGFGLWCDAPWPPAPEGFDFALALAALGYSPAAPEAARRAFLLHYAAGRDDLSADEEKALAHCLLAKKAAGAERGN
jgi:N-acetylmuramoyl-L-alanine amidase